MAALAGDGEQARLGQLGEMAARRLGGDACAPGEFARGQRLAAHESVQHIGSRAVADQRADLGDHDRGYHPAHGRSLAGHRPAVITR